MNPVIPISVALLVMFCPGCENRKVNEAELRIVELEEKKEVLNAEIRAKRNQHLQSEIEKEEAILALQYAGDKDRRFFEQVRSRLTAIESDYAKYVKLDTAGEALRARTEEFHKSYGGKVAAKVKEHEVIQRMLAAENIRPDDWSKVLDRLHRETFEGKNTIAALKQEIESLKKGRAK